MDIVKRLPGEKEKRLSGDVRAIALNRTQDFELVREHRRLVSGIEVGEVAIEKNRWPGKEEDALRFEKIHDSLAVIELGLPLLHAPRDHLAPRIRVVDRILAGPRSLQSKKVDRADHVTNALELIRAESGVVQIDEALPSAVHTMAESIMSGDFSGTKKTDASSARKKGS